MKHPRPCQVASGLAPSTNAGMLASPEPSDTARLYTRRGCTQAPEHAQEA